MFEPLECSSHPTLIIILAYPKSSLLMTSASYLPSCIPQKSSRQLRANIRTSNCGESFFVRFIIVVFNHSDYDCNIYMSFYRLYG